MRWIVLALLVAGCAHRPDIEFVPSRDSEEALWVCSPGVDGKKMRCTSFERFLFYLSTREEEAAEPESIAPPPDSVEL